MNVVGLTVTYGDREHLYLETLKRAHQEGVGPIVIVANGLAKSNFIKLSKLAHERKMDVHLLLTVKNYGSAGGFFLGLEYIRHNIEFSHLLILDDDNWMDSGALKEMLATRSSDDAPDFAVAALRPRDKFQKLAASGIDCYPRPGSFMYQDYRSRFPFSKKAEIIGDRIPYAPYGGLLLPASFSNMDILPDTQLGLYEDDTDFTSNLVKSGIPIILNRRAIVDDADGKWSDSDSGGSSLLAGSVDRLFYAVRNRTIFDFRQARENSKMVEFCINFAIYVAWVLVQAVAHRRVSGSAVFFRAVRQGMKGNLGPFLGSSSLKVHPVESSNIEYSIRKIGLQW